MELEEQAGERKERKNLFCPFTGVGPLGGGSGWRLGGLFPTCLGSIVWDQKHQYRPVVCRREESQAPTQTYQNRNLCITWVPKRYVSVSAVKFKKQAECTLQPLNKHLREWAPGHF